MMIYDKGFFIKKKKYDKGKIKCMFVNYNYDFRLWWEIKKF